MTLQRTILFDAHQALGARLIDFGGWEMPVQYSSIMEEHLAVRSAGGIFDISHMGELTVNGAGAADFLNGALTNDVRKLAVGQGQYTLLCNERGGVVDDLYAYRIAGDVFLLVVNASRIEADVSWLRGRLEEFPGREDVELGDASDNYAAVAIQGPRVRGFIDQVLSGSSRTPPVGKVSELQKNEIGRFSFGTSQVFVSCTGYTGEDGFEVIGLDQTINAVWEKALEIGKPFGLIPAGLGARDTLRTEMCYPLYGHELNEEISPIEAGLSAFVSFDKGPFTGRDSLEQQQTEGSSRRLVAFRMTGKSAPPRAHYPIWSTGADARRIGEVTSGTSSPSLGIGIGMGFVPLGFSRRETPVEIEIRGGRAPAVVVPKPLYRKPV